MQSAATYYGLHIYFYSWLYAFSFRLFSNTFKTVLEPSHISFCREFNSAYNCEKIIQKDSIVSELWLFKRPPYQNQNYAKFNIENSQN